MSSRTFARACALLALGALGACSARRVAKKVPAAGGAEPAIHGFQFTSHPALETIVFATDRASLEEGALAVLKRNAAAIKANEDWEVLVEGHCDQRGTSAYNLALGQRRAKAVRDYYLDLGVPGSRVATRSLGEEAPVCAEDVARCWTRNRRAESKIKMSLVRKGADQGT